MIYKGNTYTLVAQGKEKVGDLVHITKMMGAKYDIYEFIERFDDDGDFRLENDLPDGSNFVIPWLGDTFKVYRDVRDSVQEETQGVYVVASEIWEEDSEDFDVDLFILDTKEEAQQHVKAMGNVTRIRHRSTAKREVYIQEVEDTTKEIRIYHVKDYNPNKTHVLKSN